MSNTQESLERRWTGDRQLVILDVLMQSRSVSRAAAFAGMSRESAYGLRRRPGGALFAAARDRIVPSHRFERPVAHAPEARGRFENRASLSNLSVS